MNDYLDESELLIRDQKGIIGSFSPLPEFYEKELDTIFGMRCNSCGQVCMSHVGHFPAPAQADMSLESLQSNYNTGAISRVFLRWREVCHNRGDLARELYAALYTLRAGVHKLSHDLGEGGMMASQQDVLEKAGDIDPQLSEFLENVCGATHFILNKMEPDMTIHQHQALIFGELAIAYQYIDRRRSRKMLEMNLKVLMDHGWVDPVFAALLKHISYMYSTEDSEGIKDKYGNFVINSSQKTSRVFKAMSKAACEELNINWDFIPPLDTKCN